MSKKKFWYDWLLIGNCNFKREIIEFVEKKFAKQIETACLLSHPRLIFFIYQT